MTTFPCSSSSSSCQHVPMRVLLFWFAALLPPVHENDDVEYYAILGLPKYSSPDQIRQAYKKLSLQHHPDKQRQRGLADVDDQHYLRIQEAHTCLSVHKHRRLYHAVQCSVVRYQFLSNPGALASAYQHLTLASCEKKSRILLLLTLILLLLLLQPILVAAKLNQNNSTGAVLEQTSWIVIFVPTFVGAVLYGATLVILWIILPSILLVCRFAELIAWMAGLLVLLLQWDQHFASTYAVLFIPIYLALTLRMLRFWWTMQLVSRQVNSMVTLTKLEHDLNKSYQDLTEEEQEALAQDYVILEPSPHHATITEEEAVQASPEYHAAQDAYYQAFSNLMRTLLVGVPLVALIVCQVDHIIDVSWWLVFLPLWIYLTTQWIYACCACCCTSQGEVIVVHNDNDDDDDADDEETGQDEEHVRQDENSAAFVDPSTSVNMSRKETLQQMRDLQTRQQDDDGETKDEEDTAPTATNDHPNKDPNNDEVANNDEDPEVVILSEEENAPHLDQDAYEQFAQAQEEAHARAVEAQQKALSTCCTVSFQLVLACLIVGKLQQSQNGMGYNAFWILFPLFLVAGCILCCCAMLIYGAGQEGLDHIVERATGKEEDDAEQGDEEQGKASQDAAPETNQQGEQETQGEEQDENPLEASLHDID